MENGTEARTTNRAKAAAIWRGNIGLCIEHMCALRIGLHDREPAERHAQRCAREGRADARSEVREEPRCAGQIVRLILLLLSPRIREGHGAEPEVQPGRLDDDGGVETFDRRVVHEPRGRERLHGAAEVGVVADGKRKEVGRAGCRALSLGAGVPWRASVLGGAARLARRGSTASRWTASFSI